MNLLIACIDYADDTVDATSYNKRCPINVACPAQSIERLILLI